MSNRAAKFISAVFASILAGALPATVSLGATRAADDCLAAPNAPTADGSHWYYRIDRATKRHCWYLREQGEKLSQIRAPSSPSATISGHQAETAPQRSLADAHAELPAQSRFEQPIRSEAPVAAMQAEPAVGEPREAVAADAQGQPSVVGSRWPDPSAVTSRIIPTVMNNQISPAAPDRTAPKLALNTAAAATSAVEPTQPAAVEAESHDQSRSLPILLGAVAGASALAAIVASIILKFGAAGRSREFQVRRRRGSDWEWTDDDRIAISDESSVSLRPRWSGFERGLNRKTDRNKKIADSFSQLTRRAR
jgi:hypothetical protein